LQELADAHPRDVRPRFPGPRRGALPGQRRPSSLRRAVGAPERQQSRPTSLESPPVEHDHPHRRLFHLGLHL
ncbi:unnamed protein product, partial [Symbiodinium sp. CCMP2456]